MQNSQLYTNQHTIKKEVRLSGVGLHTGLNVNLVIKPANPGWGIRFKRVDLPNTPIIKADCDLVVDTARGTTLGLNDVRIGTIEHLMAALIGSHIDNALIELDAPEVPILDGSSKLFMEALSSVELEEQIEKRIVFNLDNNIHLYDAEKNVDMLAIPSKNFQVTTMIDFNSPVLGTQHATLKHIDDFKNEISTCRTFCFLHEIEYLLSNNLIKGGDLNNAIVVVDKPLSQDELNHLSKVFKRESINVKQEGILNNLQLNFVNEPARHKLLDIIGDLALIGHPINAHIIANRPGHSTNIAFARKIKQYIKANKHLIGVPVYDPTQTPFYDINQISKILPHKYPFLLVDKIIEMTDKHVIGVKNVTMNEQFFTGHFPGNPVMPGVLQIEAMAQVGGILALNCYPDPENYDTYFLKMDKVKFKQKVIPGDTLVISMELTSPVRRGIFEMKAMAYVGNKLVTEAELVAQLVRNENK